MRYKIVRYSCMVAHPAICDDIYFSDLIQFPSLRVKKPVSRLHSILRLEGI